MDSRLRGNDWIPAYAGMTGLPNDGRQRTNFWSREMIVKSTKFEPLRLSGP